MDEDQIDFKDLRTGQWVRIVHQYKSGKIEYVGKVSEVSQKWLKLNYGGTVLIVPQTSAAEEKIYALSDEEKKFYSGKKK